MIQALSKAAVVVVAALSLWSQRAEACGCFAPPDPSVPIVQAGERILFAVDNGKVTAHIQIQYAGDAKDFGWLLPLPSVPTLKIGTEELFTALINTTQPRYFVNTKFNGNCNGGGGRGFGFGAPSAGANDASTGGAEGGKSPLVLQSSIGPYDYAVLKADNKDAMLGWLADNRYFVPAGTEDVVGPYINPGAYFLALKLKSGKATGDIQPVVLEYPSALPMIPIILTSVAANPNMGIQVWMLGQGRAIPRNYHHVVINDAQLDWLNQASNYNDVIIKAVSEAPEKHAFATEYAGPSDVMRDVLDAPNRFGSVEQLAAQSSPGLFVQHLLSNGFVPVAQVRNNFGPVFAPALLPQLKALLLSYIPLPSSFTAQGITEDQFLGQLDFYLGDFRAQNPGLFTGYAFTFNAQTLSAEIFEKIVKPAREAGALFKAFPTLTRLYTTLSPQDMSKDPVFSFNPALPAVSRDHTATLEVNCGLSGDSFSSPSVLVTEQGWSLSFPNGRGGAQGNTFTTAPGALRIETLAEEGAPVVTLDNAVSIRKFQSCGGCSAVDPLGLGVIALLAALRRRRAA